MNVSRFIGRLVGYRDVEAIDGVRLSFGSDWAQDGPAWLLFGCLALGAATFFFYLRLQGRTSRRARLGLAAARTALLCLLFLILADPVFELKLIAHPKPYLWVLLDGTDSMAIVDDLPSDNRSQLDEAVELQRFLAENRHLDPQTLQRADFVRAWLTRRNDNPLERLSEKFRIRAWQFDDAEGVRAMPSSSGEDPERIDPQSIVAQWTTAGEVTALGSAFEDLSRRRGGDNLAGVLVISDFDYNAGPAPLNAATRLGVPVFTLGVGPSAAADLSVDLMAPLTMKKAETSTLTVTLRHRELDGATATVRLTARKTGETSAAGQPILVEERQVTLKEPTVPVEFLFAPEQTGRYIFTAEAGPVAGENDDQTRNNRAERVVQIIDDFLRLLFVEYEPTWEWRFIKEVFHRDKLVGMRGFRTYLRSADPVVRETNELFLPSLTLPRSEFFTHDVIFLGDMPASALSTRFCEMTKEFVSRFGGGLVVVAGPRFGPGELASTPLAEMLPVIVDPDARIRDERGVRLSLTPYAEHYDFMRLGQSEAENARAWANLGELPWFQAVKRVEPRASTVLAQTGGKNPEPLIAIRKYGRGEVVYIAFNEMWRLRRLYGERYYRQFWGQLIHRLGLSHALGDQKRFVVQSDKQQYRTEDRVLLTVEAYDRDFNPLGEGDVPEKHLRAEMILPGVEKHPVTIAQVRPGLFETQIPVYEAGEYRVRVTDPLSDETSEIQFDVLNVSAERRSVVRNAALQQNIASATGGKAYELTTVDEFPNDFDPPPLTEMTLEIIPLWSTWFCFTLIVGLMLGEWLLRKWVNLS